MDVTLGRSVVRHPRYPFLAREIRCQMAGGIGSNASRRNSKTDGETLRIPETIPKYFDELSEDFNVLQAATPQASAAPSATSYYLSLDFGTDTRFSWAKIPDEKLRA